LTDFITINVRTVNNVATDLGAFAPRTVHQRLKINRRVKEMNVQIESKTKETLLRDNQKELSSSHSFELIQRGAQPPDMLQGVKTGDDIE
jgi:hypothetical protein